MQTMSRLKELKKLQDTHGFDVGTRGAKSAAQLGADTNTRSKWAIAASPASPITMKKKKKKNPYLGASGPFSRKARWSKKKKTAL